jgi:hypothetical protein
VVGFYRVVGVLLDGVKCGRQLLVEYPRVDSRPVCGHLGRPNPDRQRSDEECPGSSQVTAGGQHDVDDLAVLVDSSVQVGPSASDSDVGFVDEPPIAR